MRIYTWLGRFMVEMERRIIEKDRDGWRGWDTIAEKALKDRLINNAKRGDWIDVANLAMMLWVRKQKGAEKQ